MRVLIVKTSSMGDVIHALPALTDAGKAIPGIRFDWLVEGPFVDIPKWHPLVDNVIPVAMRQWRKGVFSRETRQGLFNLRQQLKHQHYDIILDAQSLVKSAFLSYFAKGKRVGLDWRSAREPLASLAYQQKCKVNFYQHAIVRMRQLFSQALGYPLPATPPDFGVMRSSFAKANSAEKYIVLLHGTTWDSKLWPETYWTQLAGLASNAGYRIKISAGNADELARAKRIAEPYSQVDVIPRLSINDMAAMLANASGAVAVDTGFGHLAAALGVPIVSIYGSTNPEYTGALGPASTLLAADFPCAPCLKRSCTYQGAATVQPACYAKVPPSKVWDVLHSLLST